MVRKWFGRGSGRRLWFGSGSELVRASGSDVVRMWFGRGSGMVRAWFGHETSRFLSKLALKRKFGWLKQKKWQT